MSNMIKNTICGLVTVAVVSMPSLDNIVNSETIHLTQPAFSQDVNETYAKALELGKKGNQVWLENQYSQAIPILEESLQYWEQLPRERTVGNYPSVLTGLAGSIFHLARTTTKDQAQYRKAENIARKAIEEFEYCKDEFPKYRDACNRLSSGAFNVLGMSLKRQRKYTEAQEMYKESIKRDPTNNDARFNLKHLYD
jgi:tetratricopeptide (TPR) repeat protein